MTVIIAKQIANTYVATESITGTCYLMDSTVEISDCDSLTILIMFIFLLPMQLTKIIL